MKLKPEMVIFTVYSSSRKLVYSLAQKVKESLSDALVCAGGIEVSIQMGAMLQDCEYIDFLIKGEGEVSIIQLIDTIENNKDLSEIRGLIYRKECRIIGNLDREIMTDLDVLPWPDRTVLSENNIYVANISSSRGCTAGCTFCVTPSTWKKKWRGRSATDIVDEIEYIKNQYNIDSSFLQMQV